ncbi:MAG: hypothetical protein ACKJSG_13050 [Lentisphaeria bacterium]
MGITQALDESQFVCRVVGSISHICLLVGEGVRAGKLPYTGPNTSVVAAIRCARRALHSGRWPARTAAVLSESRAADNGVELADLTVQDARRYLAEVFENDDVERVTVYNRLAGLRALYRYLIVFEMVADNPLGCLIGVLRWRRTGPRRRV